MLKKINRRPEGGEHRSMSTPLNTPLGGSNDNWNMHAHDI